ncbi:hypothetical protein [Actinomadura sp. SCN-SB]|uniref:hypothetical protein n=1 Tax=Actinomadura sp. SCN-SB TaxID=3373092 RepID=UPI003750E7C0
MTHADNINANVAKANDHLSAIDGGERPTQVVEARMAVATVFMLGALISAVQELTEEIRKQGEAR